MVNLINYNGETYDRRTFTCEYVATTILPSLYGTGVKDITYGQLAMITSMLNHGWTLLPGFYGEKTSEGVILRANIKWFTIVCMKDDECCQYVASINYKKGDITLYNSTHMIATYTCLSDMFECMPHLEDATPIKCTGYNNQNDINELYEFDLRRFDLDSLDDEKFLKSKPVYKNFKSTETLDFELDTEKLNKVVIMAGV